MKISTIFTIKSCIAFFFNLKNENFEVCNSLCACDAVSSIPLHCLTEINTCESIILLNKLTLKHATTVSFVLNIFFNLINFYTAFCFLKEKENLVTSEENETSKTKPLTVKGMQCTKASK